MSSSEQEYKVPQNILDHPAWVRLESQHAYYDRKAVRYQDRFKRIKLVLIALSAGIPLIVFLPSDWSRYVVAVAGVAIAMLEGMLTLNQYGTLWTKYRGTAEEFNRERWLLLSQAGDYAEHQPDQAMRKLASRVEAILDSEHKNWIEKQQEMQGALAKVQGFVQGHMDETTRRVAAAAAVLMHSEPAKACSSAPFTEGTLAARR